jgi:predicted ATP-grasp superfamily ATP-dependent carboligase
MKSLRVLLFEHITGGGLFSSSEAIPPPASLLTEGRAMVQAIAADLLETGRVEVLTLRDARQPPLHQAGCQVVEIHSAAEERSHLLRLAAEADGTILIAPETGGVLLDRARLVESAGGRLLSPSSQLIEIAADKQRTCQLLLSQAVPAPIGRIVRPAEPAGGSFAPAILKPLDGCGSQQIRLLASDEEVHSALAGIDRPMRLESFQPGIAASVALLCGPNNRIALPACRQHLSEDGYFKYRGGSTPLLSNLDWRARRLALAAIDTLPSPLGYLGVDLVLGSEPDGSRDVVIEINPRLTTSYVGLRAACRENLAAAMLAIAAGRPATLSFRPEPVEFAADSSICSGPQR